MGSGSSKNSDNNREIRINDNHQFNNNDYDDNNMYFNSDMNRNDNNSDFKVGVLQFETRELKNFTKNFIKEQRIQDSFFKDSDNDDSSFNLLKKKEITDLSNFFKSNQSIMIDSLENKISQIINKNDGFLNMTSKILSIEKADNVFSQKIKKEIAKIENNEKEFKINYLTVMIVGKSGVGKSTLINNLLNLKGDKRAKHGVGNFQTVNTDPYISEDFPLLRLIDTRGIELNQNYGAESVKRDATKYINEQIETNNPNNFVQCIWYCITGNRFEQVEIDLLNSLRDAYDNNSIPIIIVYTQATDNNAINGMRKYIEEKNINAQFIKVLAERKELVNKQYLEPFGLDELVDETLKRCKQALKGKMRSVMTNNIGLNIKNKLIEENNYIAKYIYEKQVLNFTSIYKKVLSDKEFINYVIFLLGKNIEYYLEKNLTDKSKECFYNNDFISDNMTNYINFYKDCTNKLISSALNKYPIEFIDYQVLVERNENKDIKIKNKRCLKEFIETSKNFLNDNYYYISQVQYIYHLLRDSCQNITKGFEQNSNQIIMKMITKKDNQYAISECFAKKFGEFEKRVNNFFKNNSFLRLGDNGIYKNDFNLNNFNNNNQYRNNYQMNGFENNSIIKSHNQYNNLNNLNNINDDSENDLPSKSQVYDTNYNEHRNYPDF